MGPQGPCAHVQASICVCIIQVHLPLHPFPISCCTERVSGLRNEPGVPCGERREILRLETNGSFLWAFGDHWLQTLDGLTVQAMVEEGVLESDMDSQVLLEGNL